MYGQTATVENWPYLLRKAEGEETPLPGRYAASKPRDTPLIDHGAPGFQRAAASLTAFAQDVISDATAVPVEALMPSDAGMSTKPELPIELTKARDARLALLARKHEGVASVEDVARIHILTARLRRLDPRVTAQERATAQQVMESAEQTAVLLAQLKARYGV